MGTSIRGHISFGYDIGDNDSYPWNHSFYDEEDECNFEDGEWEDWYYNCVVKYEPKYKIYDENGNKLPNIPTEQYNQYWKDIEEFKKTHTLPFDLVDASTYSNPMFILAVPGTSNSCCCGDPTPFNAEDLQIDKDALEKFNEFVKLYFPDLLNEKPSWWLSSYYGC